MVVRDILMLLPDAEGLLAQYGLSCFHCSANATETLLDGCKSHGFSDEVISDLVTDLNEMLSEQPARPQTLTLTKDGALALQKIMAAEGKRDQGLLVGLDEAGGFCMEFQSEPASDDKTFTNAEVPSVHIFASSLTLTRIGGATIDYREGRFKLDLPEEIAKSSCGCGGECACTEEKKG